VQAQGQLGTPQSTRQVCGGGKDQGQAGTSAHKWTWLSSTHGQAGQGCGRTGGRDLTASLVHGLMAPGGLKWDPVPWVGWRRSHGGWYRLSRAISAPYALTVSQQDLSTEIKKYSNVHLQKQIYMAEESADDRHNHYEKIHFDRPMDWHWESCYTHFHVYFLVFLSKWIKGGVDLGRSHSPIRTWA